MCKQSASSSSPLTEKWVTASPKKCGRSFPIAKRRSVSTLAVAPSSPTVKLASNCSGPSQAAGSSPKSVTPGLHTDPSAAGSVAVFPANPTSHLDPALAVDDAAPPAGPLAGDDGLLGSSHPLAPDTSESNRLIHGGSHLSSSSPASPLKGTDIEDDDVDMFLNFENEDEVQLSSESMKRRRLEEGDAPSPS